MQRILLVANRTCPCPGLHDFVREQVTASPGEIVVVAPALNSRLKHWLSDTDGARLMAQERLDAAVAGLTEAGLQVRGVIGDAEPLQAIEDALADFPADAVVISTYPEGMSHWLERDLLQKATHRLDLPVRHYVSEYGIADAQPPVPPIG